MALTRKRRRSSRLSPDQFDVDSPFLQWYASYWKRNAAHCISKDIGGDLIMGPLASRRFSIGLDDGNMPLLGIADDEAHAVMSIPWSQAAFLRGVQDRDWVVLFCSDSRITGSGTPEPVSLRLWLPTMSGLLDGWLASEPKPTMLKVIEASIAKGKPTEKGGASLALLPLAFKGVWTSAPPLLETPKT
jgi:hypothetical protein